MCGGEQCVVLVVNTGNPSAWEVKENEGFKSTLAASRPKISLERIESDLKTNPTPTHILTHTLSHACTCVCIRAHSHTDTHTQARIHAHAQ